MNEKMKINVLVIGDLGNLVKEIDVHTYKLTISIMYIESLDQIEMLKHFYAFDIILCNTHVEYNYSGYELKFNSVEYDMLCFLSDDINHKTKLQRSWISFDKDFENRFIIPKNFDAIKLLLNENFDPNYEINDMLIAI